MKHESINLHDSDILSLKVYMPAKTMIGWITYLYTLNTMFRNTMKQTLESLNVIFVYRRGQQFGIKEGSGLEGDHTKS